MSFYIRGQWGIFWWSLHLNVAVFHAAFPFVFLWNSCAEREKLSFGDLRDTEKDLLNRVRLRWTFLPCYVPRWLTFFQSPPSSIWEQVVRSRVPPFCLSLRVSSPLQCQENSFQVPIYISPPPHPLWLQPFFYRCSGLCSAALRPCQSRDTLRFPSLPSLSVEYWMWDGHLMIFFLSPSLAVSRFVFLCVAGTYSQWFQPLKRIYETSVISNSYSNRRRFSGATQNTHVTRICMGVLYI